MNKKVIIGIVAVVLAALAGTAVLPLEPEDGDLHHMVDVAKRYRALLAAQRSPEAVAGAVNMQIGLFNALSKLGTLDEKRNMLSMLDAMISDTYVLSYMGRLRLNDYAEYVESACFYSDTINGMTLNMLAAAGTITIEVLQGFPGTGYVMALERAFRPHGLMVVSQTEPIVTGQDRSYVTASRQAERYYTQPEQH